MENLNINLRNSMNRAPWRLAFRLVPLALACLAPLPQVQADSKRLVVHGPFKYFPDDHASNSRSQQTRLPRISNGDAGDRFDDFEDRTPGPECNIPAKCAGTSRLHGSNSSPKAFTSWKLNNSIGTGDPQIAAGRDCLLVSAYSKIAYLDKASGDFMRVKSAPALGASTGESNRTTGPTTPIGLVSRTVPVLTNDLFAPMLDDINANLNLSAKEESDCNQANFDCHINNFTIPALFTTNTATASGWFRWPLQTRFRPRARRCRRRGAASLPSPFQ